MARIRTIKPEFPHSESMGRVSRDARLLFIQLWTLCDDSGRTRGNSRMLASLLFPYDDDAPGAIDNWLEELDREGCIVRYQIDSASYVQVCNWLNHQKIDKPSASKIPEFDESSRILANVRERSSLDQGSRIKDQGSKDHSSATPDGFAEFWSAYPKKVGKGAAQAAWKKHKPDLAICIAAITTAKASRDWQKENGQYIPNPVTWINQMRWEDGETVSATPAEFDMQAFLRSKGL